jgi:hypothetical protein
MRQVRGVSMAFCVPRSQAPKCQYICIDKKFATAQSYAMGNSSKSEQLQIRVSPAQKAAIARLARHSGQGMSSYILSRVLPERAGEFAQLVADSKPGERGRYALAALNAFLASLTEAEFADAVGHRPEPWPRDTVIANRIAAMVETASVRRRVALPSWLQGIEPLEKPVFDSDLPGLRLHLLSRSPAAFRRRNLFVDSTVGDQV